MRMLFTSQPLVRKWAHIAGSNWRTLAAAALFFMIKHQESPSIGPACKLARSMGGTSGSTALSLLLESCVNAAKRANVGEDSMALIAVTA